jgi:hypothetical protein
MPIIVGVALQLQPKVASIEDYRAVWFIALLF